jgi:hypothetical protein
VDWYKGKGQSVVNNKKYIYLISAVAITGLLIRIVLSHFSIVNLPPSSDEALSQYLAERIANYAEYPLLFVGQPYQFPVESYLRSMFTGVFEPGALEVRLPMILLHLVAVFVLCMAIVDAASLKGAWTGLIIILVPSGYWLLHQSAYFVPQYSVSALLSALIFYLVIKVSNSRQVMPVYTGMVGLLSGLALSNHLLLLPVVCGAFIAIVICGDLKRFTGRCMIFILGLIIGLIPYLLAVFMIDGAYDAITSRADPGIILKRLYQIVINHSLPGAMGLYPPYFPDLSGPMQWGLPLRSWFLPGYALILLLCTISRFKSFWINLTRDRKLEFSWPDMFVFISYAAMILMSMNRSSSAHDFRYLLPVVWSFPFLIVYCYQLLGSKLKWLLGGFVCLYFSVNVATAMSLIKEWKDAEKIQLHADIADITEMVQWMNDAGINNCYASFWHVYRITYETDKKILCAPVYNERFGGWRVPYKEQVDQKNNVAYILSNSRWSKYRTRKFEKLLKDNKVQYQVKKFEQGDFSVFYDFKYPAAYGEKLLPNAAYHITTNIDNHDTEDLADGDLMKMWSVKVNQHKGQVIDIELQEEQLVSKIELFYSTWRAEDRGHPRSVSVLGFNDGKWSTINKRKKVNIDYFRFENSQPVLGFPVQTIRFEPTWLNKVRVEITDPVENKKWGLSEVRLSVQAQE